MIYYHVNQFLFLKMTTVCGLKASLGMRPQQAPQQPRQRVPTAVELWAPITTSHRHHNLHIAAAGTTVIPTEVGGGDGRLYNLHSAGPECASAHIRVNHLLDLTCEQCLFHTVASHREYSYHFQDITNVFGSAEVPLRTWTPLPSFPSYFPAPSSASHISASLQMSLIGVPAGVAGAKWKSRTAHCWYRPVSASPQTAPRADEPCFFTVC